MISAVFEGTDKQLGETKMVVGDRRENSAKRQNATGRAAWSVRNKTEKQALTQILKIWGKCQQYNGLKREKNLSEIEDKIEELK